MKKVSAFSGVFLLLACSAALAVDFSAVIDGADGKPMQSCAADTPECKAPVTLGVVAGTALMADFPDEVAGQRGPGISPEEKFRRAALAFRIRDARDVALTAEDTALVKRVVGKAYPPVVVYRAWSLLDPSVVAKP